MKLQLEISGGIAAPLLSGQYVIDTASLPEAKRKELEELVGVVMVTPPTPANPHLRDARSYELTMTLNDRKETVVVYDGGVPAVTRRLINLIQSLASMEKSQ